MKLEIEPGNVTTGTCDCCSERTKTISGFVYRDGTPRAVYYARWTEGHPEHGADLAISIGEWAEGSSPAQRKTIGLEGRVLDNGPGFRIVDAEETPWGNEAFMGEKLTRQAALASPLSKEAFAMIDRVVADDDRTAPWFRGE